MNEPQVISEVREQTDVEKQDSHLYRQGTSDGKRVFYGLFVGDVRAIPQLKHAIFSDAIKVTAKAMDAEIEAREQLQGEFIERKRAVQEAFDDKQHELLLAASQLDFGEYPELPNHDKARSEYREQYKLNPRDGDWWMSEERAAFNATVSAAKELRVKHIVKRDEYFSTVPHDESIAINAADAWLNSYPLLSFKILYVGATGGQVEIAILQESKSAQGEFDVLVLAHGMPVKQITIAFDVKLTVTPREDGMSVKIEKYAGMRNRGNSPAEYDYEISKWINNQLETVSMELKWVAEFGSDGNYPEHPGWQRVAVLNISGMSRGDMSMMEAFVSLQNYAIAIGKAWERISLVERAEIEAIYYLNNEIQEGYKGSKIHAIKAWRGITHDGLADAKIAVEEIMEWLTS